VRWQVGDIADAVHVGLLERSRQDDLEQVVYGFDALDELGLHPLIQQSLRQAGFGVWPEQRYPSDWGKTKRSEGQRCDIVLTPEDRPLREPRVKGTLFDNQQACDADEAYWLEIKSVAQYETGGPFYRYSAELLGAVAADLKKLWTDSGIRYSGLLLLLFTEDAAVAEHDVEAWHRKCMDRGYPVAPPAVRAMAINNRIGNGWCTAAVFPVRGA
jgi:hypothetical protein